MKYRYLYFSLLSIMLVAIYSCKKDWSPGEGLSIQEASYVSGANYMGFTIKVDSTVQLTAVLTPGNRVVTNVTYSNIHPDISTVSPSGLLVAKSVGMDTLTVSTTDGSKLTTSYVVNVTE